MKALINPNDKAKYVKSWEIQNMNRNPIYEEIGYKVCEITDNEFDVAPPLFWVDCKSDINPNRYYYDINTNSFQELPLDADYVQSIVANSNQPNTTGTQSI